MTLFCHLARKDVQLFRNIVAMTLFCRLARKDVQLFRNIVAMTLFCRLARKDVQLFILHSFEDPSYQNSDFKGQTFQMTFDKVI